MTTTNQFPVEVTREGREEVRVRFPGGSFLLCSHGAHTLAMALLKAAEKQYCDGYRHGDESTMWLGFKPEGAGLSVFVCTEREITCGTCLEIVDCAGGCGCLREIENKS